MAATGIPTCLVREMRAFLRATSEHLSASRPLFTLTTGNYLTRQVLTDKIGSVAAPGHSANLSPGISLQ